MNGSVALVASKTTWARAYLSATVSGPITVSGVLTVRNTSTGASTTIAATAPTIINPAQNGQLRQKRETMGGSLNFIIPFNFTAIGTFEFEITAVSNTVTHTAMTCANCATNRRRFSFNCAAPLRLRILGIQYRTGGSTPNEGSVKGFHCNVRDTDCGTGFSKSFCTVRNHMISCQDVGQCCTPPRPPPVVVMNAPRPVDFTLLQSWLRRAYPISQLIATQGTVTSSDSWPFDCYQANAQLAAIRALEIDGGIDGRTHYLGLVSTAGGFMQGCAAVPESPDPTVVGSSPTGDPALNNFPGDVDASFGDWYGGHELAHNLGRDHPGFCGGNTSDDPSFPFPNGQLSPNDGSFTGLDVGDIANAIAPVVLPGASSFDFMTYCAQPQWLSSYSYEGIRERLAQEGDPRVCTAISSSGGLSPEPQTGEFVSIVARVNLDRGTASILYVNRVTRAQQSPNRTEKKASIRVTDSSGTVLDEYPVWLREDSDTLPKEQRLALVDAVIPYLAATARIELLLEGKVVDSMTVSKHPPIVKKISVIKVSGNTSSVAWEASDEDDGKLSYVVQISSESKLWETIAIGLQDLQLTLTPDQMRNRKTTMLRIIANDGFNSSAPVSVLIKRQ